MKTNSLIAVGSVIGLLPSLAGAQTPKAADAKAVPLPQVEIESKFFTISASAAERLGLTASPGDSSAARRSRLSKSAFEKLLGLLSAEKSVKLLSAPRVTTKSGQRAVIEVIREFRYPTEFDEGKGDQITPTKFETRNVGIALEVEPVVNDDGLIDIKATPSLTAFDHFVTYAGGKTQKSEPIPRDGFSQPIFDLMRYSVSATLRSEQTLVLGGFEWHGSDEIDIGNEVWRALVDPSQSPLSAKPGVDPKAERKLLFVTLSAKLIKLPDRRTAGDIKAGSPVEIGAKLVNVTRDRLPEWILPKNVEASGEGWMSLSGVFDSEQAEALRKALAAASGNALSAGPVKAIASNERYFVEATGLLRYPIKSNGETTGGKPDAGAGFETEHLDFQLVVEAQCQQDNTIDLNIIPEFITSPKPGEDSQPGSRPGASALEWKSLKGEPHWTKRVVTTSVSVWSGSTVILVKASEGRTDHLQLLVISAKGTPSGEAAAASESPKPPPASDKANPQK